MGNSKVSEKVILPDVNVELVGKVSGNAFAVMGAVSQAMRKAGHADRVDEFIEEASSGDYNQVLQTCMKWVNVS